MNKARIAMALAVGITVGMLFAKAYSCGFIDNNFNDFSCGRAYFDDLSDLFDYWREWLPTFILTAPVWLAIAAITWFVLPIVDRCLYAIGVDTRVIAARWHKRK